MRVRYIDSATGQDTAAGTKAAPWKSLSRLQEALTDGEIGRKDLALLKRGGEYFGNLSLPVLKGATGMFTLGTYGVGNKPVLSGYKVSSNAWVEHSAGVWKLDLTAGSGQYTGNTGSSDANVGFLKVADDFKPFKRWALADLVNDWDFYSDTTHVYVKKTASPGAGIRIAVCDDGIQLSSHVVVQGCLIEGYGAHGINAKSAANVRLKRNHIRAIGGSHLVGAGTGTTRYGNGVQFWIGASDGLVEHNTIEQCYDTATTMQGRLEVGAEKISWENIHFRHNRVQNNNQSFEVWSTGTPVAGSGFINCSFAHNECLDAGASWGDGARPDGNGTGTHLLTYNMQLPTDIEITGNVFYGASDNLALHQTSDGDFTPPDGFNSHHNKVFLRAGRKVDHNRAETVEDAAAYVAATGQESGSAFYVLPDSLTDTPSVLDLLGAQASHSLARADTERSSDDLPLDLIEEITVTTTETVRSSDPATYAKVAHFSVDNAYGIGSVLLAFQNGGDTAAKPIYGLLDIRVSGIGGSSTLTTSRVDMSSLAHMTPGPRGGWYTAEDFVAVKTVNDIASSPHHYEVELYVKTSDTYSHIAFRDLIRQENMATVTMENATPPTSTLPAGEQVKPVYDGGYVDLPSTGAVTPTTTPRYIGQEYVDTSAKVVYKATGTSSSADWTPLN